MALTRCADSRFAMDTAALPGVEVDSDHKLMFLASKASPGGGDVHMREVETEVI